MDVLQGILDAVSDLNTAITNEGTQITAAVAALKNPTVSPAEVASIAASIEASVSTINNASASLAAALAPATTSP